MGNMIRDGTSSLKACPSLLGRSSADSSATLMKHTASPPVKTSSILELRCRQIVVKRMGRQSFKSHVSSHLTCKRGLTSARSGDIFGNGQVLVVRTSKSRADPLGQLVGTKQTLGLDHLAFAVNPLGLDRVEPRALLGQQTTDDPHSRTAAALFDLSVVSSDPATYLPAYVPARVIPDQHQHLLAQPFELLRAPPLKEARGYGAYGSPFHETQPRLRQLWHIKPVARDGLRIGVILFERLLHQTQRLSSFAEAVPKVGWATLLHQHSSSKPTTQSILSSASLISRSRLLFFSHTRGRER